MIQYLNDSQFDDSSLDDELETGLKAALYRRDCPEAMILGEYHLGMLSKSVQAGVHHHLARCPHCQAELARLVDFLAEDVLSPLPAIESPSPNWVQELGFEWQRVREIGRIMIRLLGEALTPGALQPAPIALRGHQAEQGDVLRRLILSPDQTEDLDLEVTIARQTDNPQQYTLTVLAQVPNRWPDLSGVQVQATAGAWNATGTTDEIGKVILEGLPIDLLKILFIEISP